MHCNKRGLATLCHVRGVRYEHSVPPMAMPRHLAHQPTAAAQQAATRVPGCCCPLPHRAPPPRPTPARPAVLAQPSARVPCGPRSLAPGQPRLLPACRSAAQPGAEMAAPKKKVLVPVVSTARARPRALAPHSCAALSSCGPHSLPLQGNGTEEMEAVIIVDVLRRAGAEVVVASVEPELQVPGLAACLLAGLLAGSACAPTAGPSHDLRTCGTLRLRRSHAPVAWCWWRTRASVTRHAHSTTSLRCR